MELSRLLGLEKGYHTNSRTVKRNHQGEVIILTRLAIGFSPLVMQQA